MASESSYLVSDIGCLMTCSPQDGNSLGLVKNGAMVIKASQVEWSGAAADLPQEFLNLEKKSAEGRMVTPGLIDCHAHPIFAGHRANEFEMRSNGETYLDIQKAGGGIMATLGPTRDASIETHVALTLSRVQEAARWGTTTLEAKTGYDLTVKGELKCLNVAQAVQGKTPITLSPTLLGAHLIPPEFSDDREAYVKLVCEDMIPQAAKQKLCDAVDVYCDQNAFSLAETKLIFEAARRHNLPFKAHVGQFADLGGPELLASMEGLSADHLEHISEEGIQAMAAAGVVAVLLPGACVQLGMVPPPVTKFRNAGVSMAVGSDLNPGSSHSSNLPLAMWLAVTHYKMTVEEAWLGVTTHAAKALGKTSKGKLHPGFDADFVFWDAESPSDIPYSFGKNCAHSVFTQGRVLN